MHSLFRKEEGAEYQSIIDLDGDDEVNKKSH